MPAAAATRAAYTSPWPSLTLPPAPLTRRQKLLPPSSEVETEAPGDGVARPELGSYLGPTDGSHGRPGSTGKHRRPPDEVRHMTLVSVCKVERGPPSLGLCLCGVRASRSAGLPLLWDQGHVPDWGQPPAGTGKRQAHRARQSQFEPACNPRPGEGGVGRGEPSTVAWVSAQLAEGQWYSPGPWLDSRASGF